MKPRKTNWKSVRQTNRAGSAVVELAFSVPLIVLIVFGSIGASNAIYLQQIATEVAYQGALEGIKYDATEQSVLNRMQTYIDQTCVNGATFQVIGNDSTPFNDLSPGDTFRATVNIPADSMSIGLMAFSGFNDISGFRVANRQ